jgi:hypothetical protein
MSQRQVQEPGLAASGGPLGDFAAAQSRNSTLALPNSTRVEASFVVICRRVKP